MIEFDTVVVEVSAAMQTAKKYKVPAVVGVKAKVRFVPVKD